MFSSAPGASEVAVDLSERASAGHAFERHPWEVARFWFFYDVLQRSSVLGAVEQVLDVGAGDAWFAQQLAHRLSASARITCCDAEYTPELIARYRENGDGRVDYRREMPATRFGLILLLDVLEHVADDLEMLRRLVQDNLAPGGRVLVSVPAWQGLFSQHDELLRHRRRYSPAAGRSLVEQAGLVVVHGGGLFHSLLLPRVAQKAAERLLPRPERARSEPSLVWRGGPIGKAAVDWALRLDNVVSRLAADRGIELPGLSWWALCRMSS
ncbi:MAG: methyltransferase domain-containing protein [Deltaproteobacteria bacterium]|nr:methyltransferase domain-containing protein [Deltaproteobacteria bacterium]